MVLANNSHDASLVNSSGVELGLTFLRDKDNKPYYREYGDPALANQFMVGEADYAHLPPEKELQIAGDDFREGFGLLFYDPGEPKRYRDSFGVDARFRGHLLPGPLPTAIAIPSSISAPAITNAGFETGDTTGWTGLDGVDAAIKRTGSYSGEETVALSSNETFTQTLSWSATYQKRRFTLTAYCQGQGSGCDAKVGIYDGVSDQWGTVVEELDGSFHEITVSATLAATASELTIKFYSLNTTAGASQQFFWDDITLTAATPGAPVCAVDFNDELYVAFGQHVAKLNATGDGWTLVWEFPNAITHLEVFGDYLYIACGHGNNYYYMSTAEAITENTVANNDAVLFRTLGANLYKADTPRELRFATEPNAGAWSDATNVGETAYDITGLSTCYIGGTERLVIHKQNGTWYLDDDGNPKNLMPILRTSTTTYGGKNSIEWRGSLYMPYGPQLWEYTNGVPSELSPGLFTTNSSEFDGDVQALSADSSYLFAVVDNSTKKELLAGLWENVDGIDDWRWHPIAEITLAGCNGMYASTVYKKRAWIFSTSSSDSVYYINLPTGYGNVGADTNLTFFSGGYLIGPWQYANLKGDNKAWLKLTLNVSDVDATNYWTASYQIWGDTTWTTIGTFGADGSTTQTRYIPNDSGGNAPSSPMIRFKFTCTSDGAAPAPHLLSWDCRGMWYPDTKRKLIEMKVRCADNIINKNGVDHDQTEKIIRDFINAAYDPSTSWPLTFYPPYYKAGDTVKYVKLIDPLEQQLVYLAKEERWEWVYTLTLEEVALS